MSPRYLDSAAAAEYLGFGTGKNAAANIRQLVHRRQIDYIKVGGGPRLRFDVKALDAWMAKHRVSAQGEA
jgi:hypothetical protein